MGRDHEFRSWVYEHVLRNCFETGILSAIAADSRILSTVGVSRLGTQRSFNRSPHRKLCVSASIGGDKKSDRQPWDFGRFLKTVFYFNPPPTPDKVIGTLYKKMTGSGEPSPAAPISVLIPASGGPVPNKDAILVTGATGGVGKRVVALLLQQPSQRVRVLARDAEKSREVLSRLPTAPGATLELIAADLTQKATLVPEMFTNIKGVISCAAVKVSPKEGDTEDRAKYYQGIKFYDPEIVGDTPESVEYRGMQNLLSLVKARLNTVVFDADGSGATMEFGSLDDVVMGGVSSSGFTVQDGTGEEGGATGLFYGTVTSANSGGFCSVRSRNIQPPMNLSSCEGVELRLKGDGQRYKLVLRTTDAWDGIGYTVSFDTAPDTWQSIRLPFASFKPIFRAKTVQAPPLDSTSIHSLQLMLSKFEYDGNLNPAWREGPFQLPIERISGYSPSAAPVFVHVSSAGVTRPNRPGIDVDQEPPAVKMNDALGGLLTFKLKGEDEVRKSGIPYAIVRPVALTEEPAGAELVVDQGDVIKGKISREDVAELCVALLSCPEALNATFEIKSTVPFSTPWTVDPSEPPRSRDWSSLLAHLKQGVTGKTIDGVYTGKNPENHHKKEMSTV